MDVNELLSVIIIIIIIVTLMSIFSWGTRPNSSPQKGHLFNPPRYLQQTYLPSTCMY